MLRNVGRDTAAAVVVAAQALTQAAQTTTTTIAINIYTILNPYDMIHALSTVEFTKFKLPIRRITISFYFPEGHHLSPLQMIINPLYIKTLIHSK